MYFKLTVVCKGANNELRKALTSKMIGGLSMDGYRINKSCILKFNNSLGFKNVVSLLKSRNARLFNCRDVSDKPKEFSF